MKRKGLKLFALVFAGLFAMQAALPDDYFKMSQQMELFSSLLKKVDENYVEDVDVSHLVKTGMDAMFKSLDPYTNYYSGAQIEEYKLTRAKEFGDLGAELIKHPTGVVLGDLLRNFPAHKAELKTGDLITEVAGVSVSDKSFSAVKDLLKSSSGENLNLKVQRPYEESPRSVTLNLEKKEKKDVSYFGELGGGYGYIKLDQFLGQSSKEIKQSWAAIGGEKKGLVLDLRGNPGGLLREAIMVSNLFIPQGKLVVFTKGKSPKWDAEYSTQEKPLLENLPVVVLVNKRSASASEIVSGVLQDYDRGVVVGETSLGKGLVQQTKPLTFGTQMKLTTAKYYTPSGRCVQAIDYFNRNKSGEAEKVADSLRKRFTTKNGRAVFDGQGIEPDVLIDRPRLPKYVSALKKNFTLFDFATKYVFDNPSAKDSTQFNADDKVWDAFLSFVSNRAMDYSSKTGKALESLKKQLKQDEHFEALEEEVLKVEAALKKSMQEDFKEYKDEILTLIEAEVCARYFFEKGRPIASFDDDPDVLKAIQLLENQEEYKSILRP